MYSFKSFNNRYLKVLLKAYDRGRQHVDDETEWEIFFSGYLFGVMSLPILEWKRHRVV